ERWKGAEFWIHNQKRLPSQNLSYHPTTARDSMFNPGIQLDTKITLVTSLLFCDLDCDGRTVSCWTESKSGKASPKFERPVAWMGNGYRFRVLRNGGQAVDGVLPEVPLVWQRCSSITSTKIVVRF